jgi:hypothetical protein
MIKYRIVKVLKPGIAQYLWVLERRIYLWLIPLGWEHIDSSYDSGRIWKQFNALRYGEKITREVVIIE